MFYARILPPMPVVIGFYDKNLRDEWVALQNQKDLARHNEFLKKNGLKPADYPYKEQFKAITAKEAMKRCGKKDPWGKKKIYPHKILNTIDDRW